MSARTAIPASGRPDKSMHANEQSYWKEVIYIDLYTDRGDFRYRPFEGFEALED